jgi:hypothetical protein
MSLPHFVSRPSLSLVFAVSACLSLITAQAVPAAAATLKLDPTPIWAGNVAIGQTLTLSCTLTNSGPQVVTVSKATSTNSAYAVTAPSFPLTLGAGKSAKVTIQFAPKALQRITGTISFTSSATNRTLDLALNGRGVAGSVTPSLSSVNFGTVKSGATGSILETLSNAGTAPVTISSANTSGSSFGRTGITPPLTLAPSHSITFTIFFVPTAAGVATGSLMVLSNDVAKTLTIPLSGNSPAAGTLTVLPTSASLGSVAVGSSKIMPATLSASGSSIVVSGATTTSSEFTVSGVSFPLTIAAGKTASFSVNFTPNSSGTATGKLSFTANAANSPAIESLTGTGTGASQHDALLSWKASPSSVTGYDVYRSATSGGPYSKVNSALDSSTSYSDATVQANETYYYVVTGVNSEGVQGGYSNQVEAVVP